MDLEHVRCLTASESSAECAVICPKLNKMQTKKVVFLSYKIIIHYNETNFQQSSSIKDG
jgi:hypothetical protein